jgi:hypothetical protein
MVIGPRPQPEKRSKKQIPTKIVVHCFSILSFCYCTPPIGISGTAPARSVDRTRGTVHTRHCRVTAQRLPPGAGEPSDTFFLQKWKLFFGNVGLIWSDSKLLMIEVISETWSFRFSWSRGEFTSLWMISGCGLARPSLTGYLTSKEHTAVSILMISKLLIPDCQKYDVKWKLIPSTSH